MKILLRDYIAKVRGENIYKPTISNDSLHQDSKDNGVRIEKFATSKTLVCRRMMLLHRNIRKFLS